MKGWITQPRAAVVLHDLVMVVLAWTLARWLQVQMQATPTSIGGDTGAFWPGTELFFVMAVQGYLFWRTGLYKGLWRFASFHDLWNLIRACAAGATLIAIGFLLVADPADWAVTLITYPFALFLALGLPRMIYRFWKDSYSLSSLQGVGKRTLILGAGRSGALLVKELSHRGGFHLVGFLDDDRRLQGAQVHALPVLGTIDQLEQVAREHDARLAVIAMPSATNLQMQRIVEICEHAGIEFLTLPTLQDLGNKATRIDDLKPVDIGDLLGREPIMLNWQSIRAGLVGKRVLVTGGGGSIGSEICRQIARLNPEQLVVLDNSEFNLYQIEHELQSDFQDLVHSCVLGDICDPATVEKVVGEYRPDMIFHAAAYKHLPILQNQVREAFRNNVIGTLRMADAAVRHGVGKFVLISTDKAVNPSNIMGATKRVAELYGQFMASRSPHTAFITVRFGNVLNSNGSVVPLFQEQIRRGGPVTVTHPEISRYFMTISEASQLIMQAAVLGDGGEIFVLDMGEPMKITYLAEQLIRLAGKQPGRDIQIIYTGLRPGEKLFEELFHELEPYEKTAHEKIYLARHRGMDWSHIEDTLRSSELAVRSYDTGKLNDILLELVPEMARSNPGLEQAGSKVVPLARPNQQRP